MSISSISFTVVNLYESQGTRDVSRTGERHRPVAPGRDDEDQVEKAGGRRSQLVDAMMEALKQLGLTGTPLATPPAVADATPAATTPATPAAASTAAATTVATAKTPAAAAASMTSTTAVTAATSAPVPAAAASTALAVAPASTASTPAAAETVPQAVAQFAHALWTALQGSAKPGTVGIEPASPPPQAPHHHHHHGRGHAYGNFAQRLETLASASDPAVVTPTSTAAPAAAPASPAASTAAADPAVTGPAAATTTTAPATSPLAEAFGKLVTALRSAAPATSGGNTDSTDNATLLNRFLHTLAHALQGTAGDGAPASTGTLVNVTA